MSKTEKPSKVTLTGQSASAPEKQMAKVDAQALSDSDLEGVTGGASTTLTTGQVQQIVNGLNAFHIGAWGGQ